MPAVTELASQRCHLIEVESTVSVKVLPDYLPLGVAVCNRNDAHSSTNLYSITAFSVPYNSLHCSSTSELSHNGKLDLSVVSRTASLIDQPPMHLWLPRTKRESPNFVAWQTTRHVNLRWPAALPPTSLASDPSRNASIPVTFTHHTATSAQLRWHRNSKLTSGFLNRCWPQTGHQIRFFEPG